MKFSTIAEAIGITSASSLTVNPDYDPEINGVAAVDQATAGSLSYVEGEKFARLIQTTAASALILPVDQTLQQQASDRGIAWLSTTDPRLGFARAIALFYTPYRPQPGIHSTAVLDPSVRYGAEVSIGAHVVIGAEIGRAHV